MTGLTVDYNLLQPLVPFKHLLPSHLDQLLKECEVLYLFAGAVLFEKGQFDDWHYYLLSGELKAIDNIGVEQIINASSLYPIAAVQPRSSQVLVVNEATILKVSRKRLDQLLSWSQTAEYLLLDIASQRHLDEDTAWLHTILKSNLFLKVPPTNVDKIFDHLQTRLVVEHEVIVREGELGDSCYFIKEGEAEVTRFTSHGAEMESLAIISAGRCFGEDALLQETVRNATVTMKSDGVLMVLKKNDFLHLLRRPEVPTLNWHDFVAAMPSALVIDVRTESEYSQGHLANSINIPLNLLSLKGRVLKPGQSCLVYCDTAGRSSAACYFLAQRGITAIALKDGISRQEAALTDPLWTLTDYVLRNGHVIEGH